MRRAPRAARRGGVGGPREPGGAGVRAARVRRRERRADPRGPGGQGPRAQLGTAHEIIVPTLDGSFSAVWTATIASEDAFCSIVRDLQDLHSSRDLNLQNLQMFDNLFSNILTKFAQKCIFQIRNLAFFLFKMELKMDRNVILYC